MRMNWAGSDHGLGLVWVRPGSGAGAAKIKREAAGTSFARGLDQVWALSRPNVGRLGLGTRGSQIWVMA